MYSFVLPLMVVNSLMTAFTIMRPSELQGYFAKLLCWDYCAHAGCICDIFVAGTFGNFYNKLGEFLSFSMGIPRDVDYNTSKASLNSQLLYVVLRVLTLVLNYLLTYLSSYHRKETSIPFPFGRWLWSTCVVTIENGGIFIFTYELLHSCNVVVSEIVRIY